MARDIRNDDEVVLNGEVLPVREVEAWLIAADDSLRSVMTETISIRRAAAMVNGKRVKDAVVNYTEVVCTPLLPRSGFIAQRQTQQTPNVQFEIFLDDDERIVKLVVERVDLKKTTTTA